MHSIATLVFECLKLALESSAHKNSLMQGLKKQLRADWKNERVSNPL